MSRTPTYSLSVHAGCTFTRPHQLLAEHAKMPLCAFTSKFIYMVDTDASVLARMATAFIYISFTQIALVTCKQTGVVALIKFSTWQPANKEGCKLMRNIESL